MYRAKDRGRGTFAIYDVEMAADNLERLTDLHGLDDFVELVIPELQRRGIFRTEYTGTTLRDHLDLPRPENQFFRMKS